MKIGLGMLGGLGAAALMLMAAPAMAACTWATRQGLRDRHLGTLRRVSLFHRRLSRR